MQLPALIGFPEPSSVQPLFVRSSLSCVHPAGMPSSSFCGRRCIALARPCNDPWRSAPVSAPHAGVHVQPSHPFQRLPAGIDTSPPLNSSVASRSFRLVRRLPHTGSLAPTDRPAPWFPSGRSTSVVLTSRRLPRARQFIQLALSASFSLRVQHAKAAQHLASVAQLQSNAQPPKGTRPGAPVFLPSLAGSELAPRTSAKSPFSPLLRADLRTPQAAPRHVLLVSCDQLGRQTPQPACVHQDTQPLASNAPAVRRSALHELPTSSSQHSHRPRVFPALHPTLLSLFPAFSSQPFSHDSLPLSFFSKAALI